MAAFQVITEEKARQKYEQIAKSVGIDPIAAGISSAQ